MIDTSVAARVAGADGEGAFRPVRVIDLDVGQHGWQLASKRGLDIVLAPLASAQAQEADESRPVGELSLSDDTLQFRYIDSGNVIDAGRGSQVSGTLFLSEARDIVRR